MMVLTKPFHFGHVRRDNFVALIFEVFKTRELISRHMDARALNEAVALAQAALSQLSKRR
ncbi:hypothetical protein JQ616_28545 [Bradyrhizobium tropiciagri]|uniref:hypothetical protein n=1 Tax=Bradyrhizobium tropiciagri TaxID=312253 RepID=UPI001BA568A1|nr:hypothetical protein [Bradyrhizobium tropiciagri]MBR0898924.1 hypothetical protein [Bradyrhizobium tropiciagri]